MTRLIISLSVAMALAACNSTTESTPATATAESPSPLSQLEPASGTDASATEAPEPEAAAVAQEEPVPVASETETSEVDRLANVYLDCVVQNAARAAQGGESTSEAVESGVDACRQKFREARWAYRDTGVTEDAATRYGVNLLTFVRTEAGNALGIGQ